MNRQSMADRSPRKADKRSEMQQEEEKEKNAEEAAEAAPRSRRRGRPGISPHEGNGASHPLYHRAAGYVCEDGRVCLVPVIP